MQERTYEHKPRRRSIATTVVTHDAMMTIFGEFPERSRKHAQLSVPDMRVGDRYMDLHHLDYWKRIS